MIEIWIGLAHVKPVGPSDVLEGAAGAFAPVVALSDGADDFAARVTSTLGKLGLMVIEIEDIEPWRSREVRCEVDQEIQHLVESLSPQNAIAFATFEAYDTNN